MNRRKYACNCNYSGFERPLFVALRYRISWFCFLVVSPSLISFPQRNKPGKIIILYDEDERISTNSATIFVQREVDNVFLLSGG